jgi:hypothetical protein
MDIVLRNSAISRSKSVHSGTYTPALSTRKACSKGSANTKPVNGESLYDLLEVENNF